MLSKVCFRNRRNNIVNINLTFRIHKTIANNLRCSLALLFLLVCYYIAQSNDEVCNAFNARKAIKTYILYFLANKKLLFHFYKL